jgi:long-chain acyl-CoA synthetase
MPLVRDYLTPFPDPIPYTKQSVQVPGTKKPGQSAHYRNSVWGLIDRHTPNAFTTISEIFDCGMRIGKDAPFLGHRPLISKEPLKYAPYYEWQTWGQVDYRRRCVGSALSLLFKNGKLGGGELETVGIWSQNRPGPCFPLSLVPSSEYNGFGFRMANRRYRYCDLWQG